MTNTCEPRNSETGVNDSFSIKYFGVYKAINNVYAFVAISILLLLLFMGSLDPDPGIVILYLLVCFLTPVYAYYLVRKKLIHRVKTLLHLYVLLLLSLFLIFLINFPIKQFDQVIGYFIFAINVVSFAFTKWWHSNTKVILADRGAKPLNSSVIHRHIILISLGVGVAAGIAHYFLFEFITDQLMTCNINKCSNLLFAGFNFLHSPLSLFPEKFIGAIMAMPIYINLSLVVSILWTFFITITTYTSIIQTRTLSSSALEMKLIIKMVFWNLYLLLTSFYFILFILRSLNDHNYLLTFVFLIYFPVFLAMYFYIWNIRVLSRNIWFAFLLVVFVFQVYSFIVTLSQAPEKFNILLLLTIVCLPMFIAAVLYARGSLFNGKSPKQTQLTHKADSDSEI